MIEYVQSGRPQGERARRRVTVVFGHSTRRIRPLSGTPVRARFRWTVLSGVVCTRVIVSGQVQGVFYRDTCRRLAAGYGVSGWVRNLPDGRVEALFEGPPEAVERMVAWTRQGPPHAAVAHVEVYDERVTGRAGFTVRG
jgi:acylphosphatase